MKRMHTGFAQAAKSITIAALLAGSALVAAPAISQEDDPNIPDRTEGDGPYDRVILRGVYLIDGTGAPTQGPADIVIENDRIKEIKIVGAPKLAIDPSKRPPLNGGREVDMSGMYVLPGFVDTHVHLHSMKAGQKVLPEYPMKLWFAHGVTTARTVGGHRKGTDWLMDVKRRSDRNEITGPRLHVYPNFRGDTMEPTDTPEQARARIRAIKKAGGAGIKFGGAPAEVFWAALDEADKLGLNSTTHHAQTNVLHANVLTTSEHGLKSMEHWYGLPEALFDDKLIQRYSNDYIYHDEQNRFGEAGRLWKQAAVPGSDKWNEVMETLLARGFGLSPTFTIYSASRDRAKASRALWHDTYTTPNLWDFYRPSREAHGSYWFNWTLEDEIEWKNNYRLWMQFVNEYKNRGGLVSAGSDSGYIYSLYGFGYITELTMLREAGFSPLEVIYAATMMGAKMMWIDDEVGSVSVGKKADLVILKENPLENLNVLFGTGTVRLNDDTGKVERVGGIDYVMKDGILYDNNKLLKDIRDIVQAEKDARGVGPGPMPIANATN